MDRFGKVDFEEWDTGRFKIVGKVSSKILEANRSSCVTGEKSSLRFTFLDNSNEPHNS